jgi:hypothetical protein
MLAMYRVYECLIIFYVVDSLNGAHDKLCSHDYMSK